MLTGIFAESAPWDDSAWKFRQRIVIENGFYATNSDLEDFPVLIQVTDENNPVFQNARSDGADIMFTAADGQNSTF